MNNTKKDILLVAIIAATLVLGTSVIPMQSYADRDNDDHKKTKDFVSSIKASSESDKKSASQHQDQDNFCYRGDDCEQANQGQQIVGNDNDAKGFNDQSDNLAISASAAGLGNGAGDGTGTGGTTLQQKCELCLLNVDLTNFFNDPSIFAPGIDTNAELCAALAAGTLTQATLSILLSQFLNAFTEQCLIDAGIDLTVRNT